MNERGHVGEAAALYAIGALEIDERRAIDEHVSACEQCARVLGEAEAEVTLLIEADVRYALPATVTALRPPAARQRLWRPAMAVDAAAALVIGLIPTAYFWQQDRVMHETMLADARAMDRVATQKHRMAAFEGMQPGSEAKVMYAPDGSWYVVLVTGAQKALQLVWMHDGTQTPLGTANPVGDVALVYLPKSHRMEHLALMDGNRTVAEAQLAY